MLKDKQKVSFKSPEEMLDYITSDSDLYNLETGDYIWKYTECGSIAVDNFSIEEAERLAKESTEEKTYWGGLVGGGAVVYDDPSHELYEEGDETNLDYCKGTYNKGIWVDVTV